MVETRLEPFLDDLVAISIRIAATHPSISLLDLENLSWEELFTAFYV